LKLYECSNRRRRRLSTSLNAALVTQSSITYLFVGTVFIGAGVYSVLKGEIRIRGGGAVERREYPFGFWVGAIGVIILGAYAIWLGVRQGAG